MAAWGGGRREGGRGLGGGWRRCWRRHGALLLALLALVLVLAPVLVLLLLALVPVLVPVLVLPYLHMVKQVKTSAPTLQVSQYSIWIRSKHVQPSPLDYVVNYAGTSSLLSLLYL